MNALPPFSFAARTTLLGSQLRIIRNLWLLCPLAFALLVSAANAAVRVEAISGTPMGVGRVTIDLTPGSSGAPQGDDRFALSDAAGRVLYPVPEQQKRVRKILRRFLGIETPRRLTYYFLFQGNEPFEIEIYAPAQMRVTVVPKTNPRAHAELLGDWWGQYVQLYERVYRQAEYPVEVQTYLTAMWANRLGQQMPQLEGFLLRNKQQGGTVVGKLTADEAYRASVLRDLMQGRLNDVGPMQPLPPSTIRVAEAQPPTEEVAVEPIALHVPEECFYVRFGSFTNYLWFRHFAEQWQGDLGNMLVLRSIRRETSEKLSTQLGLKESALAAVLGPQVIRDVAIVGMDPYVGDGAAVGVLFHAKNNFLLATDFNRQLSAAVALHPGATQQTVEIEGHQVTYSSSPEGSLRSYYATDGDFHFVSTSRAMIARFYQAGAGKRSLAAAADFLAARQRLPIDRDDEVFLHLSSAFLKQLTSPGYRIELDRRLRSIESNQALLLARLAAKQEGQPSDTTSQLVQGGFLPESFGQRSDGATWSVDAEGSQVESLRGYPGKFLPIADHLPAECSQAEQQRYTAFAHALSSEAGALVPLSACMNREVVEAGKQERMFLELHLQRYSTTNLAPWAKKLGPADALRVAPIVGDVASLEVVLDGMLGGGEPFHLFGGLRDGQLPLGVRGGSLSLLGTISDSVEGYVGAWPKPQMLERLLGRPRGPYDADGFARTGGLFDLWCRRADDFLLFSFKRNVLVEVGNQLAMVEAPPAQARLWMRDLVGTQYEQAATSLGYSRARQTSASGSRFMNSLTQQLHVDKQQAAELANQLVDGQFVCPLGGEYLLVEVPGGVQAWASTALPASNQFLLTEIPPGYHLPLLTWFRGITAELVRLDDSLTLTAVIEMSPLSKKARSRLLSKSDCLLKSRRLQKTSQP